MEVAYHAIFNVIVGSIATPSSVSKESDESYLPSWVENSTYSYDFLDMIFPSDKTILEAMIGLENICEDLYHKSFFLLELGKIKNSNFHVRLAEDVDIPVNIFPKDGAFAEGNMENISTMIPINISMKPDGAENVHIGTNCSHEETSNYTSLFKELCDVFSWS